MSKAVAGKDKKYIKWDRNLAVINASDIAHAFQVLSPSTSRGGWAARGR